MFPQQSPDQSCSLCQNKHEHWEFGPGFPLSFGCVSVEPIGR